MTARRLAPVRRVVLVALPILALMVPIVAMRWADDALQALGEAPGTLAFFIGAIGVLGVASAGVGAAIVWRQPGNRIGILMIVGALVLETGIAAYPLALVRALTVGPADTIAGVANWWGVVAVGIGIVLLFPAVGVTFPDGRLPSRRWRRPVAIGWAVLLVGVLLQAIVPWPGGEDTLAENPFAIAGLPTEWFAVGATVATVGAIALFGMAVGAITLRFRRSTGVERAQIKWPIGALAVIAVTYPISTMTEDDRIDFVTVALGALVPISIGIAILRYRLFEIDRLVSRTIAYVVITAMLIVTYGAVILVLQDPLASVTGGDTIPVAISTLLVAALFQPLRRRVQSIVDRRFDRARFDAERTTAAFSERLREQVDIDSVTTDLRTTVQGALRPTNQGLWLRRATER